jgi:adenosylmethionine-8-amino-7-oxononanoate aminotransferase
MTGTAIGNVFYREPAARLPAVDRGEGVYFWDVEGRRYLDGCSGAVVVNVGHGRQEIVDAMTAQGRRISYTHTDHFTSEAQEEFAARVARLTPGDLNRVFPVSGGSEANETAIKLARQYHVLRGHPGKWRVIARRPSYHGSTLGALSASGHGARRRPYLPMLVDFRHIDGPYTYRCRCGGGDPACPECTGTALERAIEDAGADTVAAFVAEPVVGAAGGALVAPPGYYETVREICDRHDVLFIADEVMSGVGRTGRAFGIQHWDAQPDLLVAGKGLASGYAPLAGVAVGEHVHAMFLELGHAFVHGFTYAGHPVSCAAGVAALDIVEREHLIERADAMGAKLGAGLAELAERHPIVGDARGLGLLRGIELVADRDTKEPFPRERGVAERLGALTMERGLLVYPGFAQIDGVRGDQALIAPPLVIDDAELAELLSMLDDSLGALEAEVLR